MAKTLRVISPFFVVDEGDLFEYDNETKMYSSKHNEEFYKMADKSVDEIKSLYTSEFQISEDYAKSLIDDGYLEEVTENVKSTFVNVFDEIDILLNKYKNGLNSLKKDDAELPACVRVEKEAVLTNLVTLLEHLKSLKK